jgi:hypothetical protein
MKTKLTVRNCPVDFRFKCSKLWDELAATDRPGVRHCDRCGSDVFFCRTDEETIAHAKAGHCIAREVPDESELPKIFIGQPAEVPGPKPTPTQEEAGLWNVRESAIDDAIRNAARSSRSCPRCSYPAPSWRTTCRICGFTMGRASST